MIEARLRLTARFARFGFDVRLSLSPDILLDAMTLDRLAFVAQRHHELDSFDPLFENLILCETIRLMAKNMRQPVAFWYVHIDDRFCVLLLFLPPCLLLNVPSGTVVEVILAVFFDDLLFAVRPLLWDFVGELSDLFIIIV